MQPKIAFGEFVMDLDRCELLRAGEVIPLRPKTFDVLQHLLSNAGRVVSREELIKGVWSDLLVTDDSLSQCLVEIRRALGDEDHTIVRTVHGRGYTFDLPVETVPDDEKRNHARVPAERRGIRSFAILALGLVVAVAAGAFMIFGVYSGGHQNSSDTPVSPASPMEKSVAVLPFSDLSPDKDHEYLADGLAEEILNLLANTGQLNVIARTSSFSYRDRPVDVETIGRELNVAYVLEGSVRVAGDRVRVTVQLVNTATGLHVWSQNYDQDLDVDNLIDIQERTAVSIANAMGEKILDPVPGKLVSSKGPSTISALDAFYQGQAYLRQIETARDLSTEVFEAAIEKFEASIAADPEWAPAHVALGRTYHFWMSQHSDNLEIAKSHVMEGIRLDSEYAPAYASLGFILNMQRDYEGSMQAYQRLFELGGDMTWGYAILLGSLARFDESIEAYRAAIEKDPLSRGVWGQYSKMLLCAGRYSEAEQVLDALMQSDWELGGDHVLWIEAKLRMGNHQLALEHLELIAEAFPIPAYISVLHFLAGLEETAHEFLARALSGDGRPVELAWAAVLAGDNDLALTTLETAAVERPHTLHWMRCPPELRALAGNPRYEAVLDQVGFPR